MRDNKGYHPRVRGSIGELLPPLLPRFMAGYYCGGCVIVCGGSETESLGVSVIFNVGKT